MDRNVLTILMRKVLSFIRLLSDHQTLLSTIKCFSRLHTHFHFSSILQLSNKSNSSNSVSITYSFWWQQHHQTVSRKSKDRFSVRTAPEHLPLADLEPVRLTSLSASCKDRFVDRTGTLKAGSLATLVYSKGPKPAPSNCRKDLPQWNDKL